MLLVRTCTAIDFSFFNCIDDGFSLCCCWADSDRAGMLLKLQENAKNVFSDANVFKGGGNTGNLQHTVGYHLQKMLKKHGRIIVKNHGIAAELSCQDLTFSCDSDKLFSSSEERLLKFIILNACQGSVLVSFPLQYLSLLLCR